MRKRGWRTGPGSLWTGKGGKARTCEAPGRGARPGRAGPVVAGHRCVALVSVLALAAAAPAGAQGPVDAGVRVAPDAAIKVWNGGGSVRVEGWDADSLAVTGEVAVGRFFIRAAGDVAKLGVEGDQTEVAGRLVVRVPAGATVWIRTGAADITVRGLTGSVDISSGSGRVDVEGGPATFYAESMAGDLELHIKAGIARARTGTGRITFTGTVRDLALTTVSGAMDVTAPELQRGRFTTVDGAIAFTGAVRPAGALVFETHSGDVTLRLPAGLSADFRLATFQGALRAGYPEAGTVPAGPGRRSIRFETGAGGAEVEARSYSGDIVVERP